MNNNKPIFNKAGLWIGAILFFSTLACSVVRVEKPVYTNSFQRAGINNMPTRIIAESIELDVPVVAMNWEVTEQWGKVVAEWNVPDDDAAWHSNTSVPGGGSNIVISGHNSSVGGRVFANLEDLEIDDWITIRNLQGNTFMYQVRDKKLVRTLGASQETKEYLQDIIKQTPNEQLTLITCWPSWSNTHRLVVVADLQKN